MFSREIPNRAVCLVAMKCAQKSRVAQMSPNEQCSKSWLVVLYRWLYYPLIWGIVIGQYKDPYEPISTMECHKGFERLLKWLVIKIWVRNQSNRLVGIFARAQVVTAASRKRGRHSKKMLFFFLKIGHPKRKPVFQPSIFRCYVSFREGNRESCTFSSLTFFLAIPFQVSWHLTPSSFIWWSLVQMIKWVDSIAEKNIRNSSAIKLSNIIFLNANKKQKPSICKSQQKWIPYEQTHFCSCFVPYNFKAHDRAISLANPQKKTTRVKDETGSFLWREQWWF